MANIRKITNLVPQSVRFGLRRVAFWGTAQRCVLCGNDIRGFRDHGGGAPVLEARQIVGGMRGKDDRCPVCHGRDRTRMMMLYLEEHTAVGHAPVRLLHVAPDFGLYLWLKRQPRLDHVGSDIDAYRYRHIDGMQTVDLTDAPIPDNTFDLVVCSHVLEHIPDDGAAFKEIFRILKPGGKALLLTPFALDGKGTDEAPEITDPVERDRRFGQSDHVRVYDRGTFAARMQAAGFDVTIYDPFADLPDRAATLHLNPLELLPVGLKV